MIGYDPAAQAIRAACGLPYATGRDEPPAWHDEVPDWYWTLPGVPPPAPATQKELAA